MMVSREELARMIDHTQLHAYATQGDIDKLCDEAVRYGFGAVAINPAWTSHCAKRLAGAPVKVDATIGFPLGASTTHIKVEEAREAVHNGAEEVDMVVNIGAVKSGHLDLMAREIDAVVRAVKDVPVKVILETCYLTNDEKKAVCEACVRARAAFVKTSTGFGNAGATVEDVRLMREVVGEALGVKAAGGVRTYADAMAMIEAGATRIGTSAGVDILAGMPS